MNPETEAVLRHIHDNRYLWHVMCRVMFATRYQSDDDRKAAFIDGLLYVGYMVSDSPQYRAAVWTEATLKEKLWETTRNPILDGKGSIFQLLEYFKDGNNNLQWEYIFKLESGNKELGIK